MRTVHITNLGDEFTFCGRNPKLPMIWADFVHDTIRINSKWCKVCKMLYNAHHQKKLK